MVKKGGRPQISSIWSVGVINAVNAYEVPNLGIRKDNNYAATSEDVEPFSGVVPFKEHFLEQMEYTGPGRAIPEPEQVETVKIGFIGPIMSTVSVATGGKSHEEQLGIKMLQGARLAIEQANARGGYLKRKIPFDLVISNDNRLWGASGNEIIKMAYKDKVWAILGTIDGANTHIAIRVALKAELVMLTTGDTDPTYIETNIPWVGRTIGDDRQQGYLLVDYLYRKIMNAQPAAAVIVADAQDSAGIVNALRRQGFRGKVFGGPSMGRRSFQAGLSVGSDGVYFSCPAGAQADDFGRSFSDRYGFYPDYTARYGYETTRLLVAAVRRAGLNRARIRDAVRDLSPWRGVAATIEWDGLGRNRLLNINPPICSVAGALTSACSEGR